MHNKLWNNLKIYDKETVEKIRSITFKHNLFVKALACGRKSKRATFYNCKAFLGLAAITECPSQICDVGENRILQAKPLTLRFVAVNHPMKRVRKNLFSGCTSSKYQQQQQVVPRCPIKFFSQ